MTRTAVKICGLRSVGMIESMIKLPVDYIGFVFARSKRQVTPEAAGEMAEVLDGFEVRPQAVGVFVDPDKETLEHTVRTAKLDVVQLHGEESPELCKWAKESLRVKVFKVFSVKPESGGGAVDRQLLSYANVIDGILLDTFDPLVGGGSGKTFSWDAIPDYLAAARNMKVPLIVAGGLDADNVGELIETYGPDGVDVSSGVETDGEKDIEKIKSFVERVRSHG